MTYQGLTLHAGEVFMNIFMCADGVFFKINFFKKKNSRIPSECQKVLLGLIWVQYSMQRLSANYKFIGTWVKVQNFKNPELSNSNLNTCYMPKISSLNGQLPKNELKINHISYQNLPNSAF